MAYRSGITEWCGWHGGVVLLSGASDITEWCEWHIGVVRVV